MASIKKQKGSCFDCRCAALLALSDLHRPRGAYATPPMGDYTNWKPAPTVDKS